MTKALKVNEGYLEYGLMIIQQISGFRPYSSISFPSSLAVVNAINEVGKLAEWGMGKNMHKMKEAVLEIAESIITCSPGEPVNLNLTIYELKALKAVVNLIKRSINQQKNGVLHK